MAFNANPWWFQSTSATTNVMPWTTVVYGASDAIQPIAVPEPARAKDPVSWLRDQIEEVCALAC